MITYGVLNFSKTKDGVQDINLNQLKLKLNDTYKRDEKVTTKVEPSNKEVVVSKADLDTNLSKKEGHFSLLKKDYNEYKLRNNEQSEEVLF